MKLSARLPIVNGLATVEPLVTDAPSSPVVVIGVLRCVKITRDLRNPEESVDEPTLAFRQLEVVNLDDVGEAETLLRRALETRTGQAVLPLETENTIRELFDSITIDPTPDEGEGR